MKEIKIKETSNGFYVEIDRQEYVYRSIDLFLMLEHIGHQMLGKKIKVQEK